jgi:hypothetical protein
MKKISSLGIWGTALIVTALLMISLLGAVTNAYSQVTLSWTPPTQNSDGSSLTDLAGYNVYYGTSSGNYTSTINVGNVTTYTFTTLAAGTYYLAVTAYDTSGNQSVYSGEVVKTEGGNISGTVTSVEGTGISNVYVEVDDSSNNYIASGLTASDGTYTVGGIATGSYTVNFSLAGSSYLRQWYYDESGFRSADAVSVTAPDTTSGIDAVLAVGGSISGIVADTDGVGIPNVYVAVRDQGYNYAAQTVTASDGTYMISGIPTNSYSVNFSPYAADYVVQWYNNESSVGSANWVSVTAPDTTLGIDAQLAVGGSISGTVTDATGAGIPYVAVGVTAVSGNYGAAGLTAADGTYTVNWIPTGSYTVNFSLEGYLSQWYNNEGNSGSANWVSVTAPDTTPQINAVLAVGGSISGKVTNASEAAIPDVTVKLYDGSGNFITSQLTASDGTYSFIGLQTGSYTVNFSLEGSDYLEQWYNNQSSSGSANVISVTAPNAISGINAVLAAGGGISGTVTNASGTGIANVDVQIFDVSDNKVAEGLTAADGTYTFIALSTGNYAVKFSHNGSDYLDQWYSGESSFGSATPVPVTAPNTTTGINAVLAVAGSISGKVTNASGTGIANVDVEVDNPQGTYVAEALTASDGTYTVVGLPTGSNAYAVNFSLEGFVSQWYSNQSSLDNANLVSVTAPNTTTGINAVLAAVQYNPPTVTTTAITNVTASKASGGGSVTSNGGSPVTVEGVCWSSTTTIPTTSTGQCSSDGTATPFTSSLIGLSPNTTYYVGAYATNVAGTAYGSYETFTTLVAVPTVTTTAISNVTTTTAGGGGSVTSNGGSPVTAEGVCWSTSINPAYPGSCTSDGTVTPFASSITGLAPNTTYYVRAYATNVAGAGYGSNVTFTTLVALPTVATTAITNVTTTTASSGGNVTFNGGSAITAEGVCWSSTTTTPTTSTGQCTSDGTVTPFNSSITGLAPNTTYYVGAYATNIAGTSYGSYVSFKTLVALPTVTTTAITNVTTTTASSGGNVTFNGGSAITAEGVCWSSTTTTPTTSTGQCTSDGTATPFNSSITGLSPNTTYYVGAYATNIAGTSYGSYETVTTLVALPTVTTTAISNVTTTTASSGGSVTFNGGSAITAEGVCWSTSINPTYPGSCTSDGTVTPFTSSITGLAPNTTYYVRAYATNIAGTGYGSNVIFTTLVALPTVTTTAITNVTTTTASGGGNVTYNGGSAVTAEGVCWSTSMNPTYPGSCTSDGTATPFTSAITGLAPNTTYYVRAYATNVAGTGYGSNVTFTTLVALPTVTTTAISNVTTTTASSGGSVTFNGGSAITVEGVCWSSTTTTPTTSTGQCTSDGTVTPFNSSITGLSPNTTYYVGAYATNVAGTSYGSYVSFKTLVALPTVTTTAISNVTTTTASSGGSVTFNGGSAITAEGVCWSTSMNPTYPGSCTSDGTATPFTSAITGLAPNTTYYVRAYATNVAGTGYGSNVTFTTLVALPAVTTTAISNVTTTTASSGGSVTFNGGSAITAEGVCWSSTTTTPTTSTGQCTSDGTVTPFNSSISGLAPNTTYYVGAYATNVAGTAYGSYLSFKTLADTLAVYLTGNGGGTVTPDSGTLVWVGSTGTAIYDQGTTVTLSESANPNSYFSSWSGACNGNGSSCAVLMLNPESEYAQFNLNTNFSGAPTTGNNPLVVIFADTSHGNPTSWSWTFGDGGASTLQNPVHIYESTGNYNVSLTATGAGWEATMPQTNYITVTQCPSQPVQISGTAYAYPDIQSAFACPELLSGQVIQAQAMSTGEDLIWSENYNVALTGGFGCSYVPIPAFTTVHSLTINKGTLTIENLVIQ